MGKRYGGDRKRRHPEIASQRWGKRKPSWGTWTCRIAGARAGRVQADVGGRETKVEASTSIKRDPRGRAGQFYGSPFMHSVCQGQLQAPVCKWETGRGKPHGPEVPRLSGGTRTPTWQAGGKTACRDNMEEKKHRAHLFAGCRKMGGWRRGRGLGGAG